MKVLWIDFAQPSTWSGLLGLASLAGITLGSESIAALSVALAGAVHAYEVLRDERARPTPALPGPLRVDIPPGHRTAPGLDERAAPDADPGFNDR
ncbi:MAG: hypothetical protein RKP73_02150 [Candidatus Contendobacter sp.]|nr:hypothetical protein [Candidatus Contendobacter sp.]